LKEYNLSVFSLATLNDAKAVLNNLIQRIQKRFLIKYFLLINKIFVLISTSQSKQISVIRIVLLGNDAFVNSFLQSYVECLASRPHEYMNYFRFYFIPLSNTIFLFQFKIKFFFSLSINSFLIFG